MDNRNRNKKQLPAPEVVYGKVPPQSRDVEQAILGAILIERDAYDVVSETLQPNCFYVDAHRMIFESMQHLNRNHQPIDYHTVAEELIRREQLDLVGGKYYIVQLTNSVVNSAHTITHCRNVYEKFMKREMIRLGGQLLQEAYEDSTDAFELLDGFEKNWQAMTMNRGGQNITGIDGELVTRFKRMVELQKQDQHITGIPSGFYKLDKKTHGWQNTDLIILAARPSVGKTAFALNLARNAAKLQIGNKRPVPVGLFSLEMSKGQLVDRVIACESETSLDKIMTGQLEADHLQRIYQYGIQPLSSLGIYIDDTGALNVYQLRSKARYMIRKFGVKMIIIDYLQLMSGVEDRKINNREQEISNISRNLKLLAKELNIPIIALSQLSRNVEQRKGESKKPMLSDLRDSGAIEQDADVVMFLYRSEDSNELGENTQGQVELSIAKHRNGSLAERNEAIKLRAQLHIQKFTEWVDDPVEKITLVPGLPSGKWRPVEEKSQSDLPFN